MVSYQLAGPRAGRVLTTKYELNRIVEYWYDRAITLQTISQSYKPNASFFMRQQIMTTWLRSVFGA